MIIDTEDFIFYKFNEKEKEIILKALAIINYRQQQAIDEAIKQVNKKRAFPNKELQTIFNKRFKRK